MVGISQVKLSFKGSEVHSTDNNQDNVVNQPAIDKVDIDEQNNSEKPKSKAKLLIASFTILAGIAALIYMGIKEKRGLQRGADGINNAKKGADAYFDSLQGIIRDGGTEVKKFFDDFQHILHNKPIEEIKQEIKAAIPNFDFENVSLSDNIIKAFKDKRSALKLDGDTYSESLLQNLYAYVKRKQPEITDPKETERCRQLSIYLLSKLRRGASDEWINSNSYSRLLPGKTRIYQLEVNKETDALLDHYFGVDGLPKETRDQIKYHAEFCEDYPSPTSAFIFALQEVVMKNLETIKLKHVVDNKLSEEGLKLLEITEKIHNKTKEIYGTNDIYDKVTNYYLLQSTKAINNFKTGNFHENYHQEEWGNSGNTFTRQRKEALKVFKDLGEDLGDNPDNIDPAALKKAYLRLCKKYHPDSNPQRAEEANEIMKKINVANDILRAKS